MILLASNIITMKNPIFEPLEPLKSCPQNVDVPEASKVGVAPEL